MSTLDALKNPKAWWVIGGVAAGGGLIYEFRKSKKTKAATAATAASTASASAALTDAANSSNNTTTGIDPSTGLPYDNSGFSTGTAIGSPYGSLSGLTFDPSTGQYVSSNSATTAPTTNGQWATQAEAYLVSVGDDQTTANSAITAYLSGAGLTQAQYQAVQSALAFIGSPPVTVPNPTVSTNEGQNVAANGTVITNPPAGSTILVDYTRNAIYLETPDGSEYHLTPQQFTLLQGKGLSQVALGTPGQAVATK